MLSSSAADASSEAIDDETLRAIFLHLGDASSGPEVAAGTSGTPNVSTGSEATPAAAAAVVSSALATMGGLPCKANVGDIDDIPEYALPDAQYLERTVLPLLLRGLEEVAHVRPSDPLAFLGAYMICNNPQKHETADNLGDKGNAPVKLTPSWVSLPPNNLSTPALAEAVQQAAQRFSVSFDSTSADPISATIVGDSTTLTSKKN